MKVTLLTLAMTVILSISTTASASLLINAGFEVNDHSLPDYIYTPTGVGMGWHFSGSTGVMNQNMPWGYTAPQEGERAAFLQGGLVGDPFASGGDYIEQTFNLSQQSKVVMSFYFASRQYYPALQKIAVAIDGNIVGRFDATLTSWTLASLELGSLSAGQHTLSLAGTSNYETYGDVAAFVDNVQLNASVVSAPFSTIGLGFGLWVLGACRKTKK